MTDEDLAIVFKTMDVNGKGKINTDQCKQVRFRHNTHHVTILRSCAQALLSLGVPEGEISLDMKNKAKTYSVEEFKKLAASGLKTI